jgi:hypothetical protein
VATAAAAIAHRGNPDGSTISVAEGYAERLIESVRREGFDHIIIASERGLRRVLDEVHRLLPEIANSPGAQQGCADLTIGRHAF